jgi:hypothetical protein
MAIDFNDRRNNKQFTVSLTPDAADLINQVTLQQIRNPKVKGSKRRTFIKINKRVNKAK